MDHERLTTITRRIIGCAFTVSNILGAGFLEKVYENALAHEMREHGLTILQQRAITIRYKGVLIGEYAADFLVEDHVIVELKTVRALHGQHAAQCLNYLRATRKPLALLMNFGPPRIEIRRITLNP